MAKKKVKKFSVTKAVKATARERIGSPRPTKREENPRKTGREKHKPTLGVLLSEK